MPPDGDLPDECQLCRLLGYRGDEIREPAGMTTVTRDDGGLKVIHACARCPDDIWSDHNWTPYDTTEARA